MPPTKKFRIRLAGLRENGVIDVSEHDAVMRYLLKNPTKSELTVFLSRLGVLDVINEHLNGWDPYE